jgi:hypothetical protein
MYLLRSPPVPSLFFGVVVQHTFGSGRFQRKSINNSTYIHTVRTSHSALSCCLLSDSPHSIYHSSIQFRAYISSIHPIANCKRQIITTYYYYTLHIIKTICHHESKCRPRPKLKSNTTSSLMSPPTPPPTRK